MSTSCYFYVIYKKAVLPQSNKHILNIFLILFLSYISVFIQMEFIFVCANGMRIFLNIFSFQMARNYLKIIY